jgi:hypothetical protein
VNYQLLIFKLSIQSSYANDTEYAADENNFDTIQWFFSPTAIWRIKTYAYDNDIHPHFIGETPISLELATENTQKHYGDVIDSIMLIEADDIYNAQEVENKMLAFGGFKTLEIAPNKQFAFWNFDLRKYSSQTTPD